MLHGEKTLFLAELRAIALQISEPWILIGDFNLVRDTADKNNDLFNFREAQLFSDTINDLALIEIPLVDRAYTWSNRRDIPTLVRLDRCFANDLWDGMFPNTNLSTLPHTVSDHVPLLLTASTKSRKAIVSGLRMHGSNTPPLDTRSFKNYTCRIGVRPVATSSTC